MVPSTIATTGAATAATTPISTVTKSGTNLANGSTADSSGTTGTAKPGDTIDWVVNYTNNTSDDGTVNVTDPITAGQTYVDGSLELPPTLSPQISTNGGDVTGLGGTGILGGNPQSSSFTSGDLTFNTPGGDGYNAVGFGTNIYSVFHHDTDSKTVFCSTLDNQVCQGWPGYSSYVSYTDGAPLGTGPGIGQLTTAGVNGTFIVDGKMYWSVQATQAPYQIGVQCLDLTTLLSCGITIISQTTMGPFGGTSGVMAADGIPAANGKYYFFTANGYIACFDPATSSACGQLNISGGLVMTSAYTAMMLTGGDYVYVTFVSGGNEYIACYNTVTNTRCWGPVPANLGAAYTTNYPDFLAPVLSSTGAYLGVCDVLKAVCLSPAFTVLPNPYVGITSFGGHPGTAPSGFGSGAIVKSKFYVSELGTGKIRCYDFGPWSGSGKVPQCSGYNGPVNNLNYTVRALANLPGCLAADSDAANILVFDALTGGACVTASTTIPTSASAPSYCDGETHSWAWSTLDLEGLSGSEYGGASVTISGSNGPLSGFTDLPLQTGETSLDISSIPSSGSTSALSVTLNLSGVTDQAAVDASAVTLNRSGDVYSQICYQTIVDPVPCSTTSTVTDDATAVTTQGATTDGPSGNSSGATSFTVTPTAAQCELDFAKVASKQTARPGDTVTYTVTVTNNGTMDYTGAAPASFTDDLSDVLTDATYNLDASATAGTLAYGAQVLSWSGPLAAGATATITYSVTVDDPDTGPHTMINSVVSPDPSNCPSGSTDPACTASVAVADISIVKSATPSTVLNVGQTVTYSFLVTNSGSTSLTNVTVNDTSFSGTGTLSAISCPSGTLASGAAETCTATYVVTQADVDAGELDNTATATGTPPTGPEVTSPPSSVSIPEPAAPSLSIKKTASPTMVTAAGQTVTYSFVVKNTGNVTLTGVGVNDTQIAPAGTLSSGPTCPPAPLAPGASKTCTATYLVTVADMDNGSINDTATASGTPPSGPAVTSTPSAATVTATRSPAITIVKSASPASVSTVGSTITYSFLVTNTGNVSLTGVAVNDTQIAPAGALATGPNCPSSTLAPGASETCTATYLVTQADVDNGSIDDTATASGTPPTGGAITSSPSSASVGVLQQVSLSILKTASPSTVSAVGQTITYSFLVANPGNVTITNLAVTDTQTAPAGALASGPTCPTTTLLPGKSVTCTATYLVTQADLDKGTVKDSAIASGTLPDGTPITTPKSSATVTATQTAAINIVKTALPTTVTAAGQTVTYSFLVTNAGNVTLTGVGVNDTQIAPAGTLASGPTCPPGPLAPGGSKTCTATYNVTVADMDNGSINDTATASGTPPTGPAVTSTPSAATVTATPSPAIEVVKSADRTQLVAGQTITYSLTATNTGNVSLSNVSIAESAFTGSGTAPVVGGCTPVAPVTLAPGEDLDCIATYVVSQADVDAGQVDNTATATGTPPTGPDVTDTDNAQVPAVQTPDVTSVKQASVTDVNGNGITDVDDEIDYTVTVTNTGNTTLSNVTVNDPLLAGVGITISCVPTTLAPGASVTCTADAAYVITQADVDAGAVLNTATVTVKPPTDPPITDPPPPTVTPTNQVPEIELVKSADRTRLVAGQTITYSLTATNTGNVSLSNVTSRSPRSPGPAPRRWWVAARRWRR